MNIINEQKQLMLSGLLGDGSISQNHVSFNCMYKEYMDYKERLAGNLSKSNVLESNNQGFKKGSKIYSFTMITGDYSRYLVNTPLSETIKDLDELCLALWIMDDGSLHKKHYFYNINTHSFTREEEENILIPKLNEFGIYPTIMTEKKKDGRLFSYLYISKWEGAMVISKILRKYVVDCYKYKLIPQEIENAYFNLDLNVMKSLPTALKRTAYLCKQNGVKQISDLLINNTKGKEYTNEELNKLWLSKFPATNQVFCLYDLKESEDGDDILIPYVNFLDDNPIIKGSFKLSFNTWKYGGVNYTVEGRSLTWSMLLDILDEHGDGHHIFIELMEVKNNNEMSISLGS